MSKHNQQAISKMAKEFLDAQFLHDPRCDQVIQKLRVATGMTRDQILAQIMLLAWVA